ncbi:MAG: hypothetical protein MUO30_15175 [Anaerolineales bacterium]|nr:hypothetical protein [Anaerolineales bacterium]
MITPIITTRDRFEAWLKALDEICQTEMGISYKDLSDQHFRDWFEDGLSPEDAYYQMMENEYPGVEVSNIYYQEFDTFKDANPSL